MKGNFTFSNPTRLHFGRNALDAMQQELEGFGPTVLLTYGGGSIKKNGIYDGVTAALRAAGKRVVELPGVMPNPTIEKLLEGAALARREQVDLILAVGGGSTIDYAKGVAASAWLDGDPWQTYYVEQREPTCRVLPVASVLTMVGTGSEMNGGSVITNRPAGMKIGKVFGPALFPKFTILNPEFTYSVPQRQMVAGFFDIMSHLMEQYFGGSDDSTSDYIAEGLMRSLVHSSLVAVERPDDYEARSNIMWTATWALNTLVKCGKEQDWMVHMIGQAIGAVTDATHGMTLAAVSLPYYRLVLDRATKPGATEKFARFAEAVWGVRPDGKTPRQVALEGLDALEGWMKAIGVTLHSAELGVSEDNIEAVADATLIFDVGYKKLTRDEVVEVLRASL